MCIFWRPHRGNALTDRAPTAKVDASLGSIVIRAKVGPCAYHLPAQILDNKELAAIYPGWSADKILAKTGVRQRHIAADGRRNFNRPRVCRG